MTEPEPADGRRAGPGNAQDAGDVWAFDVDGCLIDLMGGASLRPFAMDLLTALRARGIRVVLWSGGGGAWALAKAGQFGLSGLIDGCYGKPSRDAGGRWTTGHMPKSHQPSVCVDDSPGELPRAVRAIGVRPYLAPNPGDQAFLEIINALNGLIPAGQEKEKSI